MEKSNDVKKSGHHILDRGQILTATSQRQHSESRRDQHDFGKLFQSPLVQVIRDKRFSPNGYIYFSRLPEPCPLDLHQ